MPACLSSHASVICTYLPAGWTSDSSAPNPMSSLTPPPKPAVHIHGCLHLRRPTHQRYSSHPSAFLSLTLHRADHQIPYLPVSPWSCQLCPTTTNPGLGLHGRSLAYISSHLTILGLTSTFISHEVKKQISLSLSLTEPEVSMHPSFCTKAAYHLTPTSLSQRLPTSSLAINI